MMDLLKKQYKISSRLYQEALKVSPGYLINCMANIAIRGFLPLVNIYIPKLIVDSIMNKDSFWQILFYIVLIASVNFTCNSLLSILEYHRKLSEDLFQDTAKGKLGNLVMNMKFEHIEDSQLLIQYENAFRSMFWWSGGLNSVTEAYSMMISNMISIIGIVAILVGLKQYGVIIIAALIIFIIIIEYKNNQFDMKFFAAMVKFNREFRYYTRILKDFTFGKEIRLYHTNELIMSRIRDYQKESDKIFMDRAEKKSLFGIFSGIIYFIFQAVMYSSLVVQVVAANITIGNFTMLSGAYNNFTNKITEIIQYYFRSKKSILLIHNFYSFIDKYTKETEEDRGNSSIAEKEEIFRIEFRHVYFAYPNTEQYILEDVNVVIRSDEKISIVGKNGAGKTSFIKLMIGLYQPTKGSILLNGIDIAKISKEEYYKVVAAVFQDFKIYATSIQENISMNEAIDEERLYEALEEVGLKEFVKGLPFGKDSVVSKLFSSDGIELSGGQKQRLAIARAIYRKSYFLVLDEPTAALDAKAEYEIYLQVNSMKRDKAIIFISHRLSSCKFCDRILVFDKGRIIQEGNHEQLIAEKHQLYYELFTAQAHYYIEA